MDFVVLAKQVPDVSNIPPDAWDREKGTLRRGMLDNVFNPLDLHALTFAHELGESFPDSRILCLTMGPPQAREVLEDSLARCADDVILLTDRALAGADTVATAYALARAIRRIEAEILESSEYVIVAGMQSTDGDTAQVPPQVAEELGIEHVAYAQGFSAKGGLVVRRIGPRGTEFVAIEDFPVLVTTTACTKPVYRSLLRARAARRTTVHEWDAKSIGADDARIGLRGSKTQVYRIFSPSEDSDRECVFPQTIAELVKLIGERYRASAASRPPGATATQYELGDQAPSYKGEVWVYVEQAAGEMHPVSLELLGKARELADILGEKVGAVVVGGEVEALAKSLIQHGADKVYLAQHSLLRDFLPVPYKKAVSALVDRYKPQIMLFGATPLGRELAPRVAYATGSGLTADCTGLEIGDYERGKTKLTAILKQTRPALGGNIMATIMTKDAQTQMSTVRPGVLQPPSPDAGRSGEIVICDASIAPDDLRTRIVSVEAAPVERSLADAKIIVAGGKGMLSRAGFEEFTAPLASALAEWLGGRVEIGASRVAVESGFADRGRQVGQTGQTVHPKLYMALGISGSVQHVSGMQQSETIVAVNKDPNARIFNYAHFGVVGDLARVLPELIDAIGDARQT